MGISECPGKRTQSPSNEDDTPKKKRVWGEEETEGLRREEDPELVFWETSLILALFLYFTGVLERKFTSNPSPTG